jgi:thiol-disulfide isomerase/thioredoxin
VTGLVVLAVTLLLAAAAGLVLRSRNGQVRATREAASTGAAALVAQLDALGVERGERLTLLQFSSPFCAPCRATRTLLADVARTAPDVRHVEVDVGAGDPELALVRHLDIRRTPTTVILDSHGEELARASGVPRREQVLAVVGPPETPQVSGR